MPSSIPGSLQAENYLFLFQLLQNRSGLGEKILDYNCICVVQAGMHASMTNFKAGSDLVDADPLVFRKRRAFYVTNPTKLLISQSSNNFT